MNTVANCCAEHNGFKRVKALCCGDVKSSISNTGRADGLPSIRFRNPHSYDSFESKGISIEPSPGTLHHECGNQRHGGRLDASQLERLGLK
jgi:hypothetical protein